VLPADAGSAEMHGQAQVVSYEASLTEDLPRAASEPERVALGITLANVGQVVVDGVFARDGRLGGLGLVMAADFEQAPGWDPSPLRPGERREFLFDAETPPIDACAAAMAAQANPHHGLIAVALTIVSSAGAWALADIDVAVTCVGQPVDAVSTPPARDAAVPPGDAYRVP
jgi:hypothetical protein